MQARGLAAAAIASLIGAGFSAHALGPGAAVSPPAPAAPAAPAYETDDHFPGAALLTVVDASLAPLPDAGVAMDASITPAEPFVSEGSATDRSRALECLATAVYYEAGTEPLDGQRAVAQVILNRVRHPAFPSTVCGVIYQGSERPGCQFTFACDGAMSRQPVKQYWDRARRVAQDALGGDVFAPVGLATFYHTYAVTPKWNRRMVMTGTFGAHFFHRWAGEDGTAEAFTQFYRGREPMPGPHAPVAVARPEPEPETIVPMATPKAAAEVQPAYAESGTPLKSAPALAARDDDPDSQILDKWKDSGKPIR